MLLNLSDVLSDQHSPIDAAVPLEINTMKLPGGPYPWRRGATYRFMWSM